MCSTRALTGCPAPQMPARAYQARSRIYLRRPRRCGRLRDGLAHLQYQEIRKRETIALVWLPVLVPRPGIPRKFLSGKTISRVVSFPASHQSQTPPAQQQPSTRPKRNGFNVDRTRVSRDQTVCILYRLGIARR